ncbi:restriction endonuclease [Streptomyces sp. NBC_00984]|uniref:restriction endonuclease n=1 Tax=Streptomyces sp. NBC_00984 TaxID=2903700 RepID=UPI00386882B6|nr:restriction endonuclease [Streptomyces sp. NBC_00984]
MSGTHTALHGPHGLIEAELPLDRARYEALVTAVLAWKDPHLAPRDYEQIALQSTGHARAVADDVRRHVASLPRNDGRGALADIVLRQTAGRPSAPLEGTACCAQNRARLVRTLHTRLDRLTEALSAPLLRAGHVTAAAATEGAASA